MADNKVPSGVERLYGATFRVRLSIIQVTEAGFDLDATNFEFRNPRWHQMTGKLIGRGFEPDSMDQLRESIREHGLNHGLRCRWYPYQHPRTKTPSTVQLVDGERRYRSICSLVGENVSCFNPIDSEWVPARQLYEFVECRVTDMDDNTALAFALEGNATALDIGTGAQVALVHHLRKCGLLDAEILKICRKSPDWLCKTDKLFELDGETLKALYEDRISRSVARTLGTIPDLAKRALKRRLACAATDERLANLDGKLFDSEVERLLTEAEGKVAAAMGESQVVVDANKRLAKLTKRSKRARAARNRPRTNITSGKDLARGEGEEKPKTVTSSKLRKHIYDPLCDLLKGKGHAADGSLICPEGPGCGMFRCVMEDVRMLKAFCEMLTGGIEGDPDTIILRFLTTHAKGKERRKTEVAK